jgi:outer membrane immunogenic protein
MTMGGSAAMAADMPLKAPPPPVVFSWTGCYVGIEGGGAWGRSKHTQSQAPFANQDFTPRFDISGGLGGFEYGCNQQFGGNWVFGIEGDISWSGKKGSSLETGPAGVLGGTATWSDETREKWLSTSRMRVGWTWDRAWLYVTGGFAAARLETNVTSPVLGTFSDKRTAYGWVAGAGLEYAFWNNWSLKAEYLYVNFDTTTFFTIAPVVALSSNRWVRADDHIFRVGLNWRFTDCAFGSCPVAPAPVFTK